MIPIPILVFFFTCLQMLYKIFSMLLNTQFKGHNLKGLKNSFLNLQITDNNTYKQNKHFYMLMKAKFVI